MRLLSIGMPLTIALGTASAALLLTDLTLWEAAIVGTVLAPTDAALGQAVLSNPRVPIRVVAEAPLIAGRDEMGVVVALTVLLSVLLHGVTAAPLSAVYVRLVEGMAASAPEKREMGELPPRVGAVLTNDPKATMTPNATSGRKEPDM